MFKEHAVVIATPLGDREHAIEFAVRGWDKKGLKPIVVPMRWFDYSITFNDRMSLIGNEIDTQLKKNKLVSLMGFSAGGSAVLNTFASRKESINKVITVCARINTVKNWGYRSFKNRTNKYPNYAESIINFEKVRGRLSLADLQRVMTVRPLLGDQLNPANTMILDGANNITIPTAEHITSIAMALTFFSKPLISFIKS